MSDASTIEFPTAHADWTPDRAAVVNADTGAVLTYRALEDRSRALAHAIWSWGLRPGDHVAMAVSNRLEFFEFCWAAQRIGLYYTAVNTHLTVAEARYIVADCRARVLLVDTALPQLADGLRDGLPHVERRIAIGDLRLEHEAYESIAAAVTGRLPIECEGEKMLYTSGTTGTPKGVARPMVGARPPGSVFLIRPLMRQMGFDENTVMVSPAPLYHSAPLGYGMGVHRFGGTVVISHGFDAARCLSAMHSFQATHGLFVPTMFSRMLRVPGRENYDLSCLAAAVHGAAPCPSAVKQAMIEWWGPVLYEYYAGTEGAGMTLIDSHEWLTHPGSVGRPVGGAVHILDDDGYELPPNRAGAVYFSGGAQFRYHSDASKTTAAYGPNGWNTMGDIGYLDQDGYLYLIDRKAFTVITGGVNIYPQEAEDVLSGNPLVADVAAFGVPDADLGEALIAVVQLTEPDDASDETARELWQWCSERLARQKCPRVIKFRHSLPRAENGKLYKRRLRDEYREA